MRVHEVLISMALGAILFAPIATTAENTGSPSSATSQATPAQPSSNVSQFNQSQRFNQQQFNRTQIDQQIIRTPNPASCPVGCPLDPALTARLDGMEKKLMIAYDLVRAANVSPLYKRLEEMKDQITALQTQQAALQKKMDDIAREVKAQSGTDTNITIRLQKLEDAYQHHVHLGMLAAFGLEKMPLWDCKQDSCTMNGKTVNVVSWAKPTLLPNLQTSPPIGPLPPLQ
jgi:hypothetical protein